MQIYTYQSKSIPYWAQVQGISARTIYNRIEHGWPVEEAIFTPKRCSRKKPELEKRHGPRPRKGTDVGFTVTDPAELIDLCLHCNKSENYCNGRCYEVRRLIVGASD